MAVEHIILLFLAILGIAISGKYLAKKTNLPYVLVQFFMALMIANILSLINLRLDLGTGYTDLLFYGLLPLILFESASKLPYRKIKKDWLLITMLAIFGTFITAGVFAFAITFIFGLPYWVAFLIGSLISSTDPIAVLSILKDTGISPRLIRIIDSESMLNDASSIVFSKLTLIIVSLGFANLNWTESSLNFIATTFGAVLLGLVLGLIISKGIRIFRKNPWIEHSLSLMAAFVPFLLAEEYFKISGILAVVTCGIVVGNKGIYSFSQKGRDVFEANWDFFGFLANSFTFILIGLNINLDFSLSFWILSIAAYIVLVLARMVGSFLVFRILELFQRSSLNLPPNSFWIINLTSLRGALPVITSLFIVHLHHDAINLLGRNHQIFQDLILSIVLISLGFQGFGLKFILKKTKCVELETAEILEDLWQKILSVSKTKNRLFKLAKHSHRNEDAHVYNKYKIELSSLIKEALNHSKEENLKALYHLTFNIEKSFYTSMYQKEMFGYRVMKQLNQKLDKCFDSLEEGVMPSEFCHLSIMKALSRDKQKFNDEEIYIYRKARELGNLEVLESLQYLIKSSSVSDFKMIIESVIREYKTFQNKNQAICSKLEEADYEKTLEYEAKLCSLEFESAKLDAIKILQLDH